jgi:hypothetical protein
VNVRRDVHENRDRRDRVAVGLAAHGLPGLRGQVTPADGARYGRMFSEGSPLGPRTIEVLAEAMVARAGLSNDNLRIPAGYTYFGQFVVHDVTFDPTSTLERVNHPEALADFRTPRLDLDSLYGSGPMDQPFLYDWTWQPYPGVKLLVGSNPEGPEFAAEDLPRNRQGRALIGDARNDENLIISQLHLLFIHFHNKVVDRLLHEDPHIDSTALFEQAQQTVRWHYQWIVRNDFLPRIVSDAVANIKPTLFTLNEDERAYMPVEFSAAAFRFGHSMVREDYRLNDSHPNVPILNPRTAFGPHLGGFRRLPAGLEIEWKHFFKTTQATMPQRSMRIDPSLARPLAHLPPDDASLAYLNLRRGSALRLPAGRDVAEIMRVRSLSGEELLKPLPDRIDDATREALLGATPLWYYVLCEAMFRGGGGLRLGPVGGRIVADVLTGLLEADSASYLAESSPWKPVLPRAVDDSFTMADLVKFTEAPPAG